MNCAGKISTLLEPIIEKRNYYENNLNLVHDILAEGEKQGKYEAEKTMTQVRENMKIG